MKGQDSSPLYQSSGKKYHLKGFRTCLVAVFGFALPCQPSRRKFGHKDFAVCLAFENKAPPLKYVKRFLDRLGIKKSEPGKAIITTDPDGYLASSKAFAAEARAHHFPIHAENLGCSL